MTKPKVPITPIRANVPEIGSQDSAPEVFDVIAGVQFRIVANGYIVHKETHKELSDGTQVSQPIVETLVFEKKADLEDFLAKVLKES